MRLDRPRAFIPAPTAPPRRARPTTTLLHAGASEPESSPSDDEQAQQHQQEHKHKRHQQQPDRRQQLLGFTKTVALTSLLAASGAGPMSLLPSSSSPSLLPFTPPAAWAAAEEAGIIPGLVVNKGAALSTGKAAKLIEEQCQPILQAYKADPLQRFLYRGEDIHRPTLLACPPDLLDPVTYREAGAADFFGRVEEAMLTAPDSAKTFTVRPSTGHLATSDIRCAAAWGTPCSIWPLGPLHYAWFPTIKEWWPMPEDMRAPTGDVATLRRFLLKEAKVDKDLQLALSRGHEVLLKCELPASGTGGGVTYGFLAVPIAYERELRARLGLKYD